LTPQVARKDCIGRGGDSQPGGAVADRALRGSDHQDECQRAYDADDYQITNAWRRRGATMQIEPGEVERESRAAAIRHALISRGHDPDEVENYLNKLDGDELLGDIGDDFIGGHIEAFEGKQNGDAQTVAFDRRIKLDGLYRARDAELQNEWRRGKWRCQP
jgi:hypothetical protein